MARGVKEEQIRSRPSHRPRRSRAFLHRHRVAVVIGAVVVAGLVAFVLLYFEPQKVFLNQRVNEAAPGVAATAGGEQRGPVTSPGRVTTVASGAFRSLEHGTTGRALLLQLPDGGRIIRLENLRTLNGPDLHLILSPLPSGRDAGAYGAGSLDLGNLKGNIGSQNYSVPRSVDVSKYRSVVVWCKRFTVGFGVAQLRP